MLAATLIDATKSLHDRVTVTSACQKKVARFTTREALKGSAKLMPVPWAGLGWWKIVFTNTD